MTGINLKLWRIKRRITQKELADALEVSTRTIKRLESDTPTYSEKLLKRLEEWINEYKK